MVRKIKKINYILDDGYDMHLYTREEDILKHINVLKDLLIKNKYNNKIFALERIPIERKHGKNYKVYMLVNEEYSTKDDVYNAILKYKKNGFRAYPIL